MRSLLFVPGSRPERIAKALNSGADQVCVDLEDAVAPDQKAIARNAVQSALEQHGGFGVRINSPRSDWGEDDVAAIKALKPNFVMIPKADSPGDVETVRQWLGRSQILDLIPIIESAEGLYQCWDTIASAHVCAALFGGGDLSADLGVSMDWEPLMFARSQVVAACARAQVQAIDVPYLDVNDDYGLREETLRSKALGFNARACIHPCQLATVNDVFTPDVNEIERAKAILEAFAKAEGGAALLHGKLIEKPVVLGAERTLAAARLAEHLKE